MIRAGYSRRSDRDTVISCPPSMTWLLVTITPSERTITPEPSEPSTRDRGTPAPNISKKGSTWRTTRLDEMLTTALRTLFTTGAKDSFTWAASVGVRRAAAGRGGPGSAPPGGGWAEESEGWEQAASRARRAMLRTFERIGLSSEASSPDDHRTIRAQKRRC